MVHGELVVSAVTRLTRDPLRFAAALIAAVTVASGLVQLVAPGVVLRVIAAESTLSTRHFFAIVGMFMAIVGGLLLQVLLTRTDERTVVLWGAVQKLGASIAVGVGVARGVFGGLALLIAAFDLFSCVVLGRLWVRMRR